MENLVTFIILTFFGKLINYIGLSISFLSGILYYVLIPLLLFVKLTQFDYAIDINYNYIFIYIISVIIISLCSICLTKFNQLSSFAILPLISTFMNTSFLGLPIIEALFQNPISAITVNIIQVTIVCPIFLVLLDFFSRKDKNFSILFIIKMIFNPMTVVPILTIMLNHTYLKIIVPAWLTELVFFIPYIAIIYFGSELQFTYINIKTITYNSLILILLKHILFPLVILVLEKTLFPLEKYWLYSLLILSVTPPANIVAIIARNSKSHFIEAQQVTIVSSAILVMGMIILFISISYHLTNYIM